LPPSVTALPLAYDGPPPLTPVRMFTAWSADPVLIAAVVAVAVAYLTGVATLRRRGDAWPVSRTLLFLGPGLGSLVVATMSALGTYDDTLFWIHMVQHMILTMITPVFLALGAPVTLALRTLPRWPRRTLLAVLHSRVARVLTFPLVTVPLFVGTLYGLYFTALYQATLSNDTLHELLHVHFVLVGCLYFWPLLGLDPVPGRLPHPARLLVVFVTLPIHAWLGIALMMSKSVIAAGYYTALGRPWGPSLLADQHIGGAVLWASGDAIGILFVATIIGQWIQADEREARRIDRTLDRAAVDSTGADSNDALTAYNAWLARIAEQDRARHQHP
jgi:cytochrome c oxidase assembly factor CtaG